MVEHEQRYSVVVIFIIVLVSVGAVAVMLVNSKSSQPAQFFNPYFLTGGAVNNYCKDSDGGVEPYTRGITISMRSQAVDRCTAAGVVEYSCDPTGRIVADYIPCPYGCYEGACVKSALVAYAFDPFTKSKIRRAVSS